MNLLHSRFYPACFDAFKRKSKRQTLIAVANWFGVSDKVSEDIKNTKKLKSVCHKGCSRCCYLHVSLITPGVFYIAEKLKEEFSCSKLFFIRKNLNKRAGLVSESKKDDYRARCVFHGRQTGQCVIYDYRPEPCRRFFAVSNTQCIESHGSPEQDGTVWYETGLISTIFSLAAHKNNLYIDSHEMSLSLFLALEEPTLFKRWLSGEKNIFPGVPWENYHQHIKNAESIIEIKQG